MLVDLTLANDAWQTWGFWFGVLSQATPIAPPNLAATFSEGLLSFLAPCVLPLVPGYLSYVSGISLTKRAGPDLASSEKGLNARDNRRVIFSTLLFVAGFTTIFILFFGFLNFVLDTFGDIRTPLQILAGLLVILFGLNFLGVFKIGVFNIERRLNPRLAKSGSYLGAYLLGGAFAFGWSPCVGPFLTGAIFTAQQGDSWQGLFLMLAYAAGLGLPFVLAGFFFSRFLGFVKVVRRHFHTIEVVSGLLLVGVGVLLLTGNLEQLSAQLNGINLFGQ